MTSLKLDDTDLAACVQCGLCLPHCPTFRVTGEESASPRGRIALMREVQWAGRDADEEFAGYMDACVLCRGCETACPSGVPFGRLMESTRSVVRKPAPLERLGLAVLPHHRLLLAGSSALAMAQRARLIPRSMLARFGVPARLPLRRRPLRETGDDVWLFTGCVMDAWQRDVHAAVLDVLRAMGVGATLPRTVRSGGCCGALHLHAGALDRAMELAERVMETMPGDSPVLVDSAGCGAMLKEYPDPFSARVYDVHEWLASRADRLPERRRAAAGGGPVVVQDPCHLRHVQHADRHVRTVLAPYVTRLVELDDEGLCCGAGGAYAASQPELAAAVRDRKVAAIARSGASVVASANPGCALHLAAVGLDVRHPMELVAEAISS